MKFLFNAALFKEQLKRFWIIAALPMLCYILFVILPIYRTSSNEMNQVREALTLISMKNSILLISAIIVPLITVFASFSYLFQPKATAVIHSYPLSKNQLWFTNVTAGLAMMAVPLLVVCIFLLSPINFVKPDVTTGESYYNSSSSYSYPVELFPDGISDGEVVNTLPIVIGFFFRTLLTFIFYYAVFLAAAFISGNAFVYLGLSAAIPLFPVGLCILYEMTANFYSFGYVASSSLITNVFLYTNPILFSAIFNYKDLIYDSYYSYKIANIYGYILCYVFSAAALYAVSFLCNHIRKQERASDAVIFNPVKHVLVFLASIFGMVSIGAILLTFFKNVNVMYVGFAAGFIITYFIARMITEKTLNVLDKTIDMITFASIAAGLFLLTLSVFRFDILGIRKIVLEPQDVEGVYLDNIYYYYNTPDYFKEDFFISNSDIISESISIYKQIIDNENELRDVFLQTVGGTYYNEEYGAIKPHYFNFKLKDGKLVKRLYMLPQAFVETSGLERIILSRDAALSQYHSFRLPESVKKLSLSYYESLEESSTTISIENPEHIKSVIEEIKKDIVITSEIRYKEDLENAAKKEFVYGYENYRENFINGDIVLHDSFKGIYRYGEYFSLYSSENTLAWLIKEGYLK